MSRAVDVPRREVNPDSYFPKGTPYFAPVSAAKDFDEDWVGYRKYVKEHYDGDSSKMTDEETAMFFKLKEQQQTA